MDLFRYLMTKNGHSYLKNDDLFSYKLAKGQGGTYAIFTGTTINATNTRRGKMKVNLLGNTSQTGTPTPSTPIDVNVVSGDNTIVSTGKNLANINVIDSLDVPAFKRTVANDTITIWDNTNTSGYMTTERKLSQICPSLKVGDTVTLTYTTTWSSNYIYLIGWNNVWNNGSTKTITQEMLDSTVIMYGGYNATTVISNFMFRYSTADSTYEPYTSTSYPIHLGEYELCKISTYQDRFIKTTGKNLYDLPLIGVKNGITYSKNSDGTFNLTGTATANTTFTLIKDLSSSGLINGETYTFSANKTLPSGMEMRLGGHNGDTWVRNILNVALSSTTQSITRTANTTDINKASYQVYVANGTTINISNFGTQLEKGSSATDYEPYGTNEWYLEKKIGKRILNGTENWSIQATWSAVGNKTNVFYITKPAEINQQQPCYCDYLKYVISTTIVGTDEYGISYSSSLILRMPKSITSGADLRTYLASNNMTMYYVLNTPTYTPITGTLKDELNALQGARSYDEQTNISQVNNDLSANMEANILVNE